MDSFKALEKELEKVFESVSLAEEGTAPDYHMTTEGSSSTAVQSLLGLMRTLLSNNMKMDKRLNAIEAKVMAMDTELMPPGERSNAALTAENTARDRYVKPTVN